MYSRLDYYPGYPYCFNRYDVEISILRFLIIPHATEVGIYRSPVVSIGDLCSKLIHRVHHFTISS